MKSILLLGFPNAGKSTVFNLLSGGKRKVTNYSGITVDAASSELKSNSQYPEDQKLSICDLPGTYDINPTSIDEGITLSSLINKEQPFHLVAVVVDSERLEASLSLTMGLKEYLGENLVIIINKDDHKEFNRDKCKTIEQETGLKVISVSSRDPNSRELDRFLRDSAKPEALKLNKKLEVNEEALQYIPTKLHTEINIIDTESVHQNTLQRHTLSREIIEKLIKTSDKKAVLTRKIDKIILHPVLGSIVFFGIFYLIFHSIYTWAGPAMDLIDGSVGSFGEWVGAMLPEGLFNSLVTDGIIAGVGGVVIFLPQIMILFFLLSLLEQSGYIARAAVLSDKVMNIFGLNGKAFLPYLSGFACSIPGIMAARTMPDKKERMATIMTIPMITCSARLPVYILLIGTFVPEKTVFGFLNSQALSFFFLYFLGSFFSLFMALVFRLSLFKGKSSSFFMDLPFYQKPSILTAVKQSAGKGQIFLKKAGTIILVLSMIIWVASTFPRTDLKTLEGKSEVEVAAISLQNSTMGKIGQAIEPVIKPLGMDWKMGVGLLVAFGARELFVSTMGTIYALGDVDEESDTLRERMRAEINPATGRPLFDLAVAWSILIFFVFSLQCTSTLAILKRETGGWKTPMIMFGYMTALAYIGSYIAYTALS